MNKQIEILIFSLIVLFLIAGCKKAGSGGRAELSVYVKHHEALIPGATVYLKYNAKEYPGAGPENYDLSAETGVVGHSSGHTHFKNLKPGFYYLYSVGYDSSIVQTVSGGVGIQIKYKSRKSETEVTVPVTE